MRKKIVAGNWKMNLDYTEGMSLFSEIVNMVRDEKNGDQIDRRPIKPSASDVEI